MSVDSFSLAGRGLKLDTKEDVEKHVQPLKESNTVKHIDLSGNTFGVEASAALASIISTKPTLESADLHDIFTSRLLGEIPQALNSLLTALLQCPNLHTIDLSDNAFGLNTKDPLVDFLSKHTPLKHLILNNNGMGPIAGTAIAEALSTLAEKKAASRKEGKEVPLLESIVCGRNRLENGSMAAWARAYEAHKSGIKSVKMTQNGIRPEGISHLILAGLSKCTNLEVFDLQDNTFTFAASTVLSKALLGWPKLKELGLSDDYLGGRGSVKVFQALESGKNKDVEILRLEYNDITPTGLQSLVKATKHGLPQLRRIELNGNKFDDDDSAIEELSEILSQRKEERGKDSDPLDHWGLPSLEGLHQNRPYSQQAAMNAGLVQPPLSSQPQDQGNPGGVGLTIADILPKTRNINIFASLTRDVSSISHRLESSDSGRNTTLLAPLNSVMQGLPRKPWEDRPDDTGPVRAANDEEKAARNIQGFVEQHISIGILARSAGGKGFCKDVSPSRVYNELAKRGVKMMAKLSIVVPASARNKEGRNRARTMSKSKTKAAKSAKDVDVLGKVKNAGVTKPTKSAKVQSKSIAQSVSKKVKSAPEKEKAKKAKPVESDDDSDEDSSDESVDAAKSAGAKEKTISNGSSKSAKPVTHDASDSDSDSSSEDDSKSKTKNSKAEVAAKEASVASGEDDSDDSETDASSGDDSEDEGEKPVVSAVMGAKITKDVKSNKDSKAQKNGVNKSGNDDSEDESESDSDSSDESGSEGGTAVPKVNGDVKAAPESDDDSSDESASGTEKTTAKTNGVSKASADESDDDSSEGDSESDSEDGDSGEEVPEAKPQSAKRKAEEEQPDRAIKKAKAEELEHGSNLFVGNLSWNITEEWLQEEFEQFGEITGVRLMTDRATGRSKGFGYVEFANAADAAKAHDAKKGTELDGRTMNVDFANSKPSDKQRTDNRSKAFGDQISEPADTLFMGNLAFSVTAEKITEAFEPHGGIQGIRLPTDQESGKPRGFGYITFNSIEEATAALEAMNGFYLEGRPLRLDYSGQRKNGNDSPRGGFGGRGRGRGGFGDAGGRGGFNSRGGRGGRGGRGAPRGGRGGTTNRGGFGDFSGKKTTF
ncbi:hypothetical protein DV738_g3277, partial [Chaetothyriales sp. CBS 135597]